MNRVLFCATVDYHFEAFHLPYLKWFKDNGWEVHIAAKGELQLPYVDQKYNLPFERAPLSLKNLQVYRALKEIIEANKYRIIHCHTPVGGVLTRLAARKARKSGTKVIYTAHGFHFCKGAPLINWLMYYPIERWLASYTDCLITINREDYALATTHKFPAVRIEHVHGVGVDTEKYKPVSEEEKQKLRTKLGYSAEHFILFYAAELNKNKNQQLLIKLIAALKDQVPNVRLLLAGNGSLMEYCQELSQQLGVAEMISFLGYTNDIDQLLPICDLAVASSLREGLPVNIMEAMACGLPVLAIDNRGHRELVTDNENGWLVYASDMEKMPMMAKQIVNDNELKVKLGNNSRSKIENAYALNRVINEMSIIYNTIVSGEKDESTIKSFTCSG